MFSYPEKTKVNNNIDLKSLYTILYKNNDIDLDCKNISNITVTNIFNSNNLGIKTKGIFKEIYIIKVDVAKTDFPYNFFNKFDEYIEIPTLYVFSYRNLENYILSIKTKEKEKNEINRIFVSGWGEPLSIQIPKLNNIEEVFYFMIENFTNLKFKENETYKQYIKRLISTNKEDKKVLKGFWSSTLNLSNIVTCKIGQEKMAKKILSNIFDFYFDNSRKINGCYEICQDIKKCCVKNNFLFHYYKEVLNLSVEVLEKREIDFADFKKAFAQSIKPTYGINKRVLFLNLSTDDLIKRLISIIQKFDKDVTISNLSNELYNKKQTNFKNDKEKLRFITAPCWRNHPIKKTK